jgi:Fe-S-cluster containining protein
VETSPAQRHYLDVRAILIEGTYVIKAPCKYLIEPSEDDLANGIKCRCGVDDNKPELCRIFKGKRQVGKYKFWVPPGCTMSK